MHQVHRGAHRLDFLFDSFAFASRNLRNCGLLLLFGGEAALSVEMGGTIDRSLFGADERISEVLKRPQPLSKLKI